MNVEDFISAVFVRPALWDQKEKNHHNRYLLDKLWDEVANQLNITRANARGKWKSIRDKFRTTLSTIPVKRSGDGGDAIDCTKVTWVYFKSLLFLKDQFTPRKTSGNLPANSQLDRGILEDDATQEDDADDAGDSSSLDISLASPRTSNTPSPSLTDVHVEKSSPRSSNYSNKRTRQNELLGHALLNVENEKLNYLKAKQAKQDQGNDDEDLNFFKSLLPHVQKFSASQKMTFRIKVLQHIQEIVDSNKNDNVQQSATHQSTTHAHFPGNIQHPSSSLYQPPLISAYSLTYPQGTSPPAYGSMEQ